MYHLPLKLSTKRGTAMLFENVAEQWFKSKSETLKITTLERYRIILEKYLCKNFGFYEMSEITSEKINVFVSESCINLKSRTVKLIVCVFKNILCYSGRTGTAVEIKKIHIMKHAVSSLTLSESSRLNNELFLSDNPLDLGILLALNTGIRLGEVCALKYRDIDFSRCSIHITGTVHRIRTNLQGKRTVLVCLPPQSESSVREVPVPQFIMKKLSHISFSPDSFLLTGGPDKMPEPRTLERHFSELSLKYFKRRVKFHDLRHTYATISISGGTDEKTVSEILGHADVATTLTYYRGVNFDDKLGNVRVLEKMIGPKFQLRKTQTFPKIVAEH